MERKEVFEAIQQFVPIPFQGNPDDFVKHFRVLYEKHHQHIISLSRCFVEVKEKGIDYVDYEPHKTESYCFTWSMLRQLYVEFTPKHFYDKVLPTETVLFGNIEVQLKMAF